MTSGSWLGARRLALLALTLVVATVALVVVIHTPPVRRMVLRYAIAEAKRRFAIQLDAASLDYNLPALSVGLSGVRVAAARPGAVPFFEASYLRATLSPRVLFGVLALNQIDVTGGQVRIARDANGTNLPDAGAGGAGEPAPLSVGRVSAPGLKIDISDTVADVALSVPAIDVGLATSDGRVALKSPARLSAAGHQTQISSLDGGISFDGRTVTLSGVAWRLNEASGRLDGSLRLLVQEPALDLTVAGAADLEQIARWLMPGEMLPQGMLAFDAHATGALTSPVADVQVSSPRLTWTRGDGASRATLVVTDLSTTSRITAAAADVREMRLEIARGTLTGTARIPLDDSVLRVNAAWRDVDAAALTAMATGPLAVSPSGALSGTVEATGPLARLADWNVGAMLHVAGGTTGRGLVTVPGDSQLQLTAGEWRATARHLVGGGVPLVVAASGQIDPAALANSTLSGQIDVADIGVPMVMQLVNAVGLGDVPAGLVSDGTLTTHIDLSGRFSDPRVAGDLQARRLSGDQFHAEVVDAAVAGQLLGPHLSFSLMAGDLTAADQHLKDITASGRFDGDVIRAESLSAAQTDGPGSISASGLYNLSAGRYDAMLDLVDWNIVPTTVQPLGGVAHATFRGAGTIRAPLGSGSVRLENTTLSGSALGELSADIALDGQAANVMARAAAFNLALTASTRVRAPYDTVADVTANATDIARLTALRPDLQTDLASLEGQVTLAAHVEGPLERWRDGSATVDVTVVDARLGELPIRLGTPARLAYDRQVVHVESLEVDAGATRISAAGELPLSSGSGTLLLTALGDIGETTRAVATTGLAKVPLTGSGPLALLARVTGSVEQPLFAADLEAGPGSITVEGLSMATGVVLRAHVGKETVDLREAHASYEGAAVDATGSIPLSLLTSVVPPSTLPASLHLTAAGITPAVLRGMVEPAVLDDIRGNVDVAVNLETPSLDLAQVRGDLTLTRFDVQLSGLSVAQRVPTRIVASDGFARIDSWNWAGEGATLGVFGQVRLADRQAAILANGDVDLRVLTPFVRTAGITTAGHLVPRLSVTGPLDNPRLDGDVAVEGGEVRLLDPRIIVNGLTARAALTRSTATLTALSGSINGGTLTGGGTIEYQPETGSSARLSTSIRTMALEFPTGLQSELDADLQFEVTAPPGQAAPSGSLTGMVTVLHGAYREPLAVVGGLLAALRARQAAAAAGDQADAGAPSTLLQQLALDVRLQTDEDVVVDNNYARVQLGLDVNLIGTAAAPGMSGRAILREDGQLFVGRNVYTIKSDAPSTIDFVSPTTIAPELNVSLSTRAAREDIDVTLRGPAESPQVEMTSTNGLGQADITALLLTGRTLDELSTSDASFIGAQVLGNFSGEVLGFAGRAVGLDTLRLGGIDTGTTQQDATSLATEVDPTSRLTFGKSLGPFVDLTFSQSLRDASAQTWIVEYLPVRRVEVRVVSDDSDLRSYGFRHDVSFGGTRTTAVRATRAADRPTMRVADVTVTGNLGFPEERVRGLLRLNSGDRFDFASWQEDRDRLENFYHGADHLAARVTAGRLTTGDRVTLSYLIDAGPRTQIELTGIPGDRALLNRLTETWVGSIFDDFLVDEATQVVRATLVERGFPQPMVTTRIVRDGDTATLRIEVEPGGRSETATIRVDTPDPELAEDLQDRIEQRQLAAQVVRDPGAVQRDLTAELRSRGYLRASVSVGSLIVDGTAAIVPVVVNPGEVFEIDSVAFNGRAQLPADEVLDASGVVAGVTYDPALLETGRDRLVALYRRRGFASAVITPRATIRAASPRVAVTFDIKEGAPQNIADIVVTGNRGVDTDVIERALRLNVGDALEPEELVRARTRIFDTGLFRRVDVTTEMMPRAAADAPQPMQVRVAVEAWPALRLRYGFTVAEERSETDSETRRLVPGLSADLTRRTLFGRPISLAGAVEYQRRERVVRGVLSAPTMLSLPIRSSLVVERSRREIAETRVTDRNSISWEERTRVATHLNMSFAYTYERNHTFVTVQRPGEPTFDIRTPIARLTSAIAWDTRDDPVNATHGLLLSTSGTYAPKSLGSAFRFSKVVGQGYAFQSLHGIVFASAVRLGLAWGLGGQELVPSERFFAGGARTVRGVADDSLGERDFFGPLGGRAMLVLNHEVRFPIFRWIGGVGFVDAGNVFTSPADIRVGDLDGAFGVGLRLSTPFALLRADYGRVVWGPESVAQSGRWVVGIGHAF